MIPMAICYDFDGTLAPGNMQEYDFIPSVGVSPKDFWEASFALAEKSDADTILAYMRLMLRKAEEAEVRVTRDSFRAFGSTITFFPGVEAWFSRIDAYAHERGVLVEHYIISSGLREMIEGTAIAGEFKRIYASGFMYDENDVAVWPALAINYTTKTQFLFRINKGSLEVYDNTRINKYVPKGDRPLPFTNMVYIGDGETDIPCFRLVKKEGGYAIAVYPPRKPASRALTERLLEEGRANLIAPADYTEGSRIDLSVKAIVDRIEATARIG
ncbi:MAG: phosphoserine phosphatase [Spirochaetae bacterium HGW-Spirochaetae-3]|jgi:phosphoserine phosphatase|nr:MAG: phosphoserine phosphatase [Spirochaetae bacterium HGW-Spirochaetae-3]